MRSLILAVCAVTALAVSIFAVSGCRNEPVTLWGLKCAACHDGKTVLNDKVVPNRAELVRRYKDIDQFMRSCISGPPCMNILKQDEKLFEQVGREIGIPEADKKGDG